MTLRNAYFSCFFALVAAACGGSVFGSKDDGGAGGGGTTGGTGSDGGSSTVAGKPSNGGSTSSGGSHSTGGDVAVAGSVSVGGSVSVAGSTSTAGSAGVGGGPNCAAVDCAEPVCADGATPVVAPGACCGTCPPDKLVCKSDGDCLMASRPQACCGCPQPINKTAYDADPCWSDVAMPRMVPQSCYPKVVCNVICECPAYGTASCTNDKCTSSLGAK